MFKFKGNQDKAGVQVQVRWDDGGSWEPLPNPHRHSPGNFDWGILSDGASDLALALLACQLGGNGDPDFRVDCMIYQEYRARVVQSLENPWTLDGHEIEEALFHIRMTHEVDCYRCGDSGQWNAGKGPHTCTCPAGARHTEQQQWVDANRPNGIQARSPD